MNSWIYNAAGLHKRMTDVGGIHLRTALEGRRGDDLIRSECKQKRLWSEPWGTSVFKDLREEFSS